jgi:hypothetical protein
MTDKEILDWLDIHCSDIVYLRYIQRPRTFLEYNTENGCTSSVLLDKISIREIVKKCQSQL